VDPYGNNKTVTTRKVSCQDRLGEIQDLSSNHSANTNNENMWGTIRKTTKLWARGNETLVFHVRIEEGSHLEISWKVKGGEGCKTKTKGTSPEIKYLKEIDFNDDIGDSPCVFPFRFDNVLYYGCTRIKTETEAVLEMCANSTDKNYNAVTLSWCDSNCHFQS
jgi:hypothetical protein